MFVYLLHMIPYKHLFFDLDNTLIDFQANAREAFQEIFTQFGLDAKSFRLDKFLDAFSKHNEYYWMEYRSGRIKKDHLQSERFIMTFREMGIHDRQLANKVGNKYIEIAPQKTNLFDHVHDTLLYLKSKYNLYILTNGFAEIQLKKIAGCSLQKYFGRLFIAEMVGYQKPDKRFFEYAVKSIHAHKKECLMTGDDPDADIAGASNAGIDQVFFNPQGKTISFTATYEIACISELMKIL